MRLTSPSELTFYLSLLLAFMSAVIEGLALTHIIQVGYCTGGYVALLFAYLLLFAGNVSKGI